MKGIFLRATAFGMPFGQISEKAASCSCRTLNRASLVMPFRIVHVRGARGVAAAREREANRSARTCTTGETWRAGPPPERGYFRYRTCGDDIHDEVIAAEPA
jgi:hypothetical protein